MLKSDINSLKEKWGKDCFDLFAAGDAQRCGGGPRGDFESG